MVRDSVIKILNNSFGLGGGDVLTGEIRPLDGYDESPDVTVMRDRYAEILFTAFSESEFWPKYHGSPCRIAKNDLRKFYNTMAAALREKSDASPYETVLAVCSFADLPYEYVWRHIVPPDMKVAVYEELYRSGYKDRIDRSDVLV